MVRRFLFSDSYSWIDLVGVIIVMSYIQGWYIPIGIFCVVLLTRTLSIMFANGR